MGAGKKSNFTGWGGAPFKWGGVIRPIQKREFRLLLQGIKGVLELKGVKAV